MSDITSLIAAAKCDFYDKEAAYLAEIQELHAKKTGLQQQVQREQEEAQRKLTLKVTPLNTQIEEADRLGAMLTQAFQAYAAEKKAEIAALTRMGAKE